MSSSIPAGEGTPENWWSTSIIDMKPGMIRYRGYAAISELKNRTSRKRRRSQTGKVAATLPSS